MSESRISRRSTEANAGWNTPGVVRWVLVWAGFALVAHVVYLLGVLPTVDRDIVFFLAGKNGQGQVRFVIEPDAAAVVATVALVVGAVGALAAFAMSRAGRRGAHAVAVLSLAAIAGSLALTAGGIVAALVDRPITEPGLPGGAPGLVAAVVFFSQLIPLFAGRKGKRARRAS